MKRLIFLSILLLVALSPVVYTQEIGGISSILSPVKFGGKKLPSWLNSEYAPIFNGVNQHAITPSIAWPPSSGAFSWMGWVKRYNITLAGTKYLLKSKTNADGRIFIYTNNTTNIFISNGLGTIYSRAAWNAATTAVWSHLAYVSSPNSPLSSGTVYVDGVPIAWAAQVGATSSAFVGVADEYLFGGNYAAGGFNGSLAEMSLWNRALSQSEILRYKDKRLRGTETGLVALYHMNDNAQTLIDSVGGKNAVASNSVAWTKRNGYAAPDVRAERYALSFDGVDDYASGTNNQITTYPITIESWARTDGTPWGAANGLDDAAATSGYIILKTETGNQVAGVVSNGTTAATMATASRGVGIWQHLALSINEARIQKFYLNGDLVSSGTAPVFATGIGKVIHMNHTYLNTTSPRYAKGKSAEFRIWNTARTQAEIQANLYTQMTGSETGLVYYYRGNEGTGSTLTNLGSAGSTGNLTLYNSPTWTGRDIP